MKKKILALIAFAGVSLGISLCLNCIKKGKEKDTADDENEEVIELAD